MAEPTAPRFEWDEDKNSANKRKHGVAFEEAVSVFSDDRALLIDDPDHSVTEERFVILGLSSLLRTLVVCHCYRSGDDTIRLISARRATRGEQDQYNRRGRK